MLLPFFCWLRSKFLRSLGITDVRAIAEPPKGDGTAREGPVVDRGSTFCSAAGAQDLCTNSDTFLLFHFLFSKVLFHALLCFSLLSQNLLL